MCLRYVCAFTVREYNVCVLNVSVCMRACGSERDTEKGRETKERRKIDTHLGETETKTVSERERVRGRERG